MLACDPSMLCGHSEGTDTMQDATTYELFWQINMGSIVLFLQELALDIYFTVNQEPSGQKPDGWDQASPGNVMGPTTLSRAGDNF